MSEPVNLPPPQPPQPPQLPTHNGRKYLLGLGLGFVPVLLEWLSGVFTYPLFTYSAPGPYNPGLGTALLQAGVLLYVVAIIAMIALLANRTVRFIGYGLLTMVLAAPVVAVVGCLAISGATHTA